MKQDLPVYVISLEHAIERREKIKKSLDGMGVDFEFWRATDDRNLRSDEIAILGEDRLKQYKCSMNLGALGCLLSHYRIYQYILSNSIGQSLILEDDVKFHPEFNKILEDILRTSNSWNLLHLGYAVVNSSSPLFSQKNNPLYFWHKKLLGSYTNNKGVSKNFSIGIVKTAIGLSHGYLINNIGARYMMEASLQGIHPIDWAFNCNRDPKRLAISPSICYQTPGGGSSYIGNSSPETSDLPSNKAIDSIVATSHSSGFIKIKNHRIDKYYQTFLNFLRGIRRATYIVTRLGTRPFYDKKFHRRR